MDRLICFCNGVKEGEITKVIIDKGASKLSLIQEMTGAACNCGRCIPTIDSILDRHTDKEEIYNNSNV